MLTAGAWTAAHLTSSAVRGWRPGAGESRAAGRLQVRTFGSGTPVVVLLHGMAAAGDFFGVGFDPLGDHATVVVPDLLGFGGSTTSPGPLTATDHLDALDEALEALGLGDRRLVVVGHSMGGALALCWAARNTPRVRAVVTLCAALYRTRDEADGRVRQMGTAEALLAGDGPLPETLCGWMCRHRALASWFAVAIRPDLPVTVARSAGQTHLGQLPRLARRMPAQRGLGTRARGAVSGGSTHHPCRGRPRPGPRPRARRRIRRSPTCGAPRTAPHRQASPAAERCELVRRENRGRG